jgi:hypothetical protein
MPIIPIVPAGFSILRKPVSLLPDRTIIAGRHCISIQLMPFSHLHLEVVQKDVAWSAVSCCRVAPFVSSKVALREFWWKPQAGKCTHPTLRQ